MSEDDKKVEEDGAVEESPEGTPTKPTVRGRRLQLKTGVRGGGSNMAFGTWSCAGATDSHGGGKP